METFLWSHPGYPGTAIRGDIGVTIERPSAGTLRIGYVAAGRISDIVLPAPAQPLRTDNLWKTTCFEVFLAPAHVTAYRELNFSPSSQWAAYDFSSYRSGMVQAALPAAPEIRVERTDDLLTVNVLLNIDIPLGPCLVGLAAVIEETGGSKSYWALSHSSGAPDFHRRDCFALELPAPEQP